MIDASHDPLFDTGVIQPGTKLTSQLVLFNLLGTPENDKRMVSFDGGHVNLLSNMDLVRATVDWLDQYSGPVGTSS